MKKYILYAMIFAILFQSANVFASDGELSLSDVNGQLNDTVLVTANMTNNGACVGSIVLQYDNEKLEFTENIFSDSIKNASPMINPEFKENQIKLSWFSLNSNIDFKDFCKMSFRIKSSLNETVNIEITEVKLYDIDSKPISVNLKNAAITIKNENAEPQPEEKNEEKSVIHSSGGSSPGGSSPGGSSQETKAEDKTSAETEVKPETKPKAIAVKFNDIDNFSWAKEAIVYLAEKSIINGVSENMFAPAKNVTRAEFITVLCRANGIEPCSGDNFSDCGDTWYTGYLAAAKQNGISNGVGDNKFAPEMNITREEMVTLIYKCQKEKGEVVDNVKSVDFTDKEKISAWAKDAVDYAYNSDIVKGRENNMFDPQGAATRAELAQIFYNINLI